MTGAEASSSEPADSPADPGDFRALLREGRNVCPVAEPAPHFVVFREPVVRSILRDDGQWRSGNGPGLTHARRGGVLVSSDPPTHTAQRGLLSPGFRASATADLEDPIRASAGELMAELAPKGRGDLIADLAAPLSLSVVCRLLGLPTDRIPDYWSWALSLAEGLSYPSGSVDRRVVDAYRAFYEHFSAHIAARKGDLDAGRPVPEDLLDRFMTGPTGRSALSRAELLGFCQFLLVAGSTTTALLIGNLMYRLLHSPEQLAAVRADRSMIPKAIEESLRLDAPLRGLFRTAARPTELEGVEIPALAKVLVMFEAANRDLGMWPDADRFDLTRDPQSLRRHYSFGHGIHYCLGAPLARMEAKIAVNAILDHLPGLRSDGGPRPVSAELLNGFSSLPVAWN